MVAFQAVPPVHVPSSDSIGNYLAQVSSPGIDLEKFKWILSLQGEIFSRDHRSPVAFLAPVMSLPEEHSRMIYFAISNYAFNTASLVYHKVGFLNFSITDDMVRIIAQ